MTILVRNAEPWDRERLVQFTHALNLHEFQVRQDRDTSLEGAEEHLAAMEKQTETQGGFILVAEDGDALAGFLIGIKEAEQGHFVVPAERSFGHIADIYVAEAARGKGVSRALVDAAIDRFRAMGLNRVLVTGLADNPLAAAAYPALGFKLLYSTYEKRLDD